MRRSRADILKLRDEAGPESQFGSIELSNLTDDDVVFFHRIREGVFDDDNVEKALNQLFESINAANKSGDKEAAEKLESRIHFYHWVRTQIRKKKV